MSEEKISGDWTKCRFDAVKFLNRLERMKKGEKTVCPFCGGTVALISEEASSYLYGCDTCDMRISTDIKSCEEHMSSTWKNG